MTIAVCITCGELKYGAFFPCGSCHVRPKNDHELVQSFAFSERYLDDETLEKVSEIIRTTGKPPEMTETAYALLSKFVVEAKTSLRMDERFAQFDINH